MSNERAILQGYLNKANGDYFEQIIEAACEQYAWDGVALIDKTPEPMRPERSLGRGRFVAHFAKKAQPDFKGTLDGGRAIIFDAKHTDTERLEQRAVTGEQTKALDLHAKLGGACFVLVSFGMQRFFMVPWEIFREMKAHYGRKYITPTDVKEYEVPFTGIKLEFLRGLGTAN